MSKRRKSSKINNELTVSGLNRKDLNGLKSAIRRAFSRSTIRQDRLKNNLISHFDPERPRVTKWCFCDITGVIFPAYLAEIDHIIPVVSLTKTAAEMTKLELLENIYCSPDNLQVLSPEAHQEKTTLEKSLRKTFKASKKS